MRGNALIPIALFAGLCNGIYSQFPGDPGNYAEELLFMDESAEIPLEALEKHQELLLEPLDLNSADQEKFAASGLFTPSQIRSILRYREQFGPFYSIFELKGISGITTSGLREIAPFLTAGEGIHLPEQPSPVFRLILTLKQIAPSSSGYGAAYTGIPLKTALRIRGTSGKQLSWGMGYEKDAGEPFLHKMVPEHLAGHLSFNGNGFVKQIVAGTFQLQNGLGLVNGTGFLHSPENYLQRRSPLMLLKPYASAGENRYGQGIGLRMETGRIALLFWSSCQKIDLSIFNPDTTEAKPDWIEYQRITGLHRTSGELSGRSLASWFHTGIQSLFNTNRFSMGSTFAIEGTSLTRKGADSLSWNRDPVYHGIMSLYGGWQGERLALFGEAAVRPWQSTAIQGRIHYNFSDFLQILVLMHRYGQDYRGILPSAYASGSNPCNESGFTLHLHAEPGTFLTAGFTAGIFSYPLPRYMTRVPTRSYRFIWTLSSAGSETLKWRIRMTKKSGQTNPVKANAISRLEIMFGQQPHTRLSWQTRIICSWPGVAAVQQAKIALWNSLTCNFQFVVFRIDEWEKRIYLYEPGLYYSFNFPVCYGNGQKITAVITYAPGKRLTCAFKGSAVSYFDRETIGSGNDLINGNKKWELGLQMRFRL